MKKKGLLVVLCIVLAAMLCSACVELEESTLKELSGALESFAQGQAAPVEEAPAEKLLDGKIIILHTNDIHGRAEATNDSLGYAGVAQIKQNLEDQGAIVYLMDAGDAMQGAPVVNFFTGESAVEFMNAAGYDVACPGNHELDWGIDNFEQHVGEANFPYICANLVHEVGGEPVLDCHVMIDTPNGFKLGVFGLDTPEAKTKTNPALTQGITFLAEDELVACAQKEVDELKAEGCDLIICLGHLGQDEESKPNRSIDLLEKVTGIDLFIDGHSHTTLDNGEMDGDTLRVSTGCYNAALGYVVYEAKEEEDGTKKLVVSDKGLYKAADSFKILMGSGKPMPLDEEVDVLVEAADAIVDEAWSTVFAETAVFLNGEKAPGNRTEETNLGDFCTDAILWKAKQASGRDVVAAFTNGGGIRASIEIGPITMKDMKTVFPFGNTICTLDMKGSEILEMLEAGTFCTPEAVGAFPQVSGIVYTVDTTKPFEQGEQYPDSTYYAPANPGTRVTIASIGGEDFDPEKIYTVATNNFSAAGGDTFYVCKYAYQTSGIDTGVALEDGLIDYIQSELGGVIGEQYAEPQGRITVIQ